MKKIMLKIGCITLICLIIAHAMTTNVKTNVIIGIATAMTMLINAYCVENKVAKVLYAICATGTAFFAGALMAAKGIYLF